MTITHNFIFTGPSTMDEVRGTLRLAELAVESIYGHDRVHLETHATLDEQLRCCAIDTSSKVGRVLAVVFAGFIRQESGSGSVRVQRITTHHHHDSMEVAYEHGRPLYAPRRVRARQRAAIAAQPTPVGRMAA